MVQHRKDKDERGKADKEKTWQPHHPGGALLGTNPFCSVTFSGFRSPCTACDQTFANKPCGATGCKQNSNLSATLLTSIGFSHWLSDFGLRLHLSDKSSDNDCDDDDDDDNDDSDDGDGDSNDDQRWRLRRLHRKCWLPDRQGEGEAGY